MGQGGCARARARRTALEVLEPSTTLDITEFMASNDATIVDGNGKRSDWIEVHNYGAIAIDLDGWSLTDNAGNLRKWIFRSGVHRQWAAL